MILFASSSWQVATLSLFLLFGRNLLMILLPPPRGRFKFEVRTAFPPRAYGDLTKTLAEEKLVPSAKVHVLRVV
jgi:hypothetical protein